LPLLPHRNGAPKRPMSSNPRRHRCGIRSKKKQKQDANPGAINTKNILSFGIILPSVRMEEPLAANHTRSDSFAAVTSQAAIESARV
jgi:hypothetical protein